MAKIYLLLTNIFHQKTLDHEFELLKIIFMYMLQLKLKYKDYV